MTTGSLFSASPLREILDQCFDEIAIISQESHRIVCVNQAFADRLGVNREELVGTEIGSLFDATTSHQLEAALTGLNDTGHQADEPSATLHLGLARDLRIFRIVDSGQRLFGLVLRTPTASDQSHPSDQSRHDPLTGLPDRSFLFDRIETLLHGDRFTDRSFAVVFTDVDHFKRINDRFGHLVGDQVLCEVATRLRKCVREGDHVTRFGGDEFVLLLEQIETLHDVAPIVERIRAAIAEPFSMLKNSRSSFKTVRGLSPLAESAELKGTVPLSENGFETASNQTGGDCPNFAESSEQNGSVPLSPPVWFEPLSLDHPLSLSIGVALATDHHRSADEILAEADHEMYANKRAQPSVRST